MSALRRSSLGAALAAVLATLAACEGVVSFRGKIVDSAGNPVQAARDWTESGGRRAVVESDSRGCVADGFLTSPRAREARIGVGHAGFKPVEFVIELEDGPAVLEFRLVPTTDLGVSAVRRVGESECGIMNSWHPAPQ